MSADQPDIFERALSAAEEAFTATINEHFGRTFDCSTEDAERLDQGVREWEDNGGSILTANSVGGSGWQDETLDDLAKSAARIVAQAESCACPDEPHQNALHDLAHDFLRVMDRVRA